MKNKIIVVVIISIIVSIVGIIIKLGKTNVFDYELEKVNEINYMLMSENNKYGVIDKNGKIVIQPLYDEIQIPNPSKPLFICLYNYNQEKQQYNIKVLNENSEQILYQYIFVEAIKINVADNEIPYEKSVLKYKENDKYGLIDFEGNKITKPKYDSITGLDYKEGMLLVQKNNKYGVINIKGQTVIKEKYDIIQSDGYYEDGADYKKSGFIVGEKSGNDYLYGFINFKGKQLLKIKYNQIERIKNTTKNEDIYLVAFKDEKAGFYKNDKLVLEHKYEDIFFDENINSLIIQENQFEGIATLEGNIQIDIKYDNIFTSGKYVNTIKDSSVEIFDYTTKEKINIENVICLNETLNSNYTIAITNNEKYKIFDNTLNQFKEKEYDYLEYLYEEYFIAVESNKFGIVDVNGNIIVQFNYDYIGKINNTKLLTGIVYSNNTTDIICENNIIVSMKNADIIPNSNYIKLQSDSNFKYIDYSGNLLENIYILDKELYAKEFERKWGFINKNGETIISPEYDFVTEFNEYGYAGIMKNGNWGVINTKGEVIVEPKYIINEKSPNFIGEFYEMDLGYGTTFFSRK